MGPPAHTVAVSSCCCPESLDDGAPTTEGAGGPLIASYTTPVAATGAVLVNLINQPLVPLTLARNGDWLRLRIGGTFLTGASKAFTLTTTLAGVLSIALITGASGITAVVRPWWADLQIVRVTSATARIVGVIGFQGSVAVPLAGVGSLQASAAGGPVGNGIVDVACDWTAAQSLLFGVIPSAAGPVGDNFTMWAGSLQRELAP